MRAGDVSRPALAPRERRLLEFAASGESIAAIGRKPGMRRPLLASVDHEMVGEAVAGQRVAPRGPGPCTRRRVQNRGRT